MWEFSLNIRSENFELAKFFYNTFSSIVVHADGVITSHEENGYISILFAVNDDMEYKVKSLITNAITEVVCNKFKADYLNNSLILPEHDVIGMSAFKKALLNFDKETDKFIIKKNLNLGDNLYFESFYEFRLRALRDKWAELVTLSNENREYLVSKDSFVDLLKFLVDNLDICENEISIVKEDGGYRIYTEESGKVNQLISEESMVSSVIDLSPQKINLYFNESSNAINLLERIFEERITINQSTLQNIKKFKLN